MERWVRAGFAALVVVCLLLPPSPAAAIFQSSDVANANLKPFPKWTGMLQRYFTEQQQAGGECLSGGPRCPTPEWRSLIEELRLLDRQQQLARVNAHMNRFRYIIDPINWGVDDYWTTPAEFFAKHGDCEDYAIAKYLTLRAAGVPAEDMRIVVVQDMNLRVAHAVLAVYVEDKAFVLDNQIRQVVESESIRHYRAIFSINEQHWWLHKPAGGR